MSYKRLKKELYTKKLHKTLRRSYRGIFVKVLNCGLEVNEFEL